VIRRGLDSVSELVYDDSCHCCPRSATFAVRRSTIHQWSYRKYRRGNRDSAIANASTFRTPTRSAHNWSPRMRCTRVVPRPRIRSSSPVCFACGKDGLEGATREIHCVRLW